MLDEMEIEQIHGYLIRVLPQLIRHNPEIVTTIEGILAEQFPRRDEFARMLDELQTFRQESNQRFDELHTFRQESGQRFEQVDQRFEQVDQRFEEARKDRLSMKRDIAKLHHGQEMILKRMDHQEAWLNLNSGNWRVEKGRALEDIFAEALRYGLKNPQISADKLRLRQKLVDTQGYVFKAGFVTEVDLIAEDEQLTVFEIFEIKASTKASEVDIFALKVELVQRQNPDKQVRGILICLAPPPEVRQRCLDYGLELVG